MCCIFFTLSFLFAALPECWNHLHCYISSPRGLCFLLFHCCMRRGMFETIMNSQDSKYELYYNFHGIYYILWKDRSFWLCRILFFRATLLGVLSSTQGNTNLICKENSAYDLLLEMLVNSLTQSKVMLQYNEGIIFFFNIQKVITNNISSHESYLWDNWVFSVISCLLVTGMVKWYGQVFHAPPHRWAIRWFPDNRREIHSL